MNKYQESFKKINVFFKGKLGRYNRKFPFTRFDLLNIEELVDKTTLTKPTKNNLGQFIIAYTHECTKCGNYLEVSNKYCSECGTELDWSENEWGK